MVYQVTKIKGKQQGTFLVEANGAKDAIAKAAEFMPDAKAVRVVADHSGRVVWEDS